MDHYHRRISTWLSRRVWIWRIT